MAAESGSPRSLSCAICEEDYTSGAGTPHLPMHLPCGHVLCASCLDGLGDRRLCPFDRSAVPAKVPTSYAVVSIIDAMAASRGEAQLCAVCGEDESTSTCRSCRMGLCAVCAPAHTRLPGNRGHNVVNGVDRDATAHASKAALHMCGKHVAEELKFWCDSCHMTVCRDCVAIEHRTDGHDVTAITDAPAALGDAFASAVSAVQKRKAALERVQHDVTKKMEEVPAAIRAFAEEEMRVIREREALLQSQWDSVAKKYVRLQTSVATSLSTLHAMLDALQQPGRDPVATMRAYQEALQLSPEVPKPLIWLQSSSVQRALREEELEESHRRAVGATRHFVASLRECAEGSIAELLSVADGSLCLPHPEDVLQCAEASAAPCTHVRTGGRAAAGGQLTVVATPDRYGYHSHRGEVVVTLDMSAVLGKEHCGLRLTCCQGYKPRVECICANIEPGRWDVSVVEQGSASVASPTKVVGTGILRVGSLTIGNDGRVQLKTPAPPKLEALPRACEAVGEWRVGHDDGAGTLLPWESMDDYFRQLHASCALRHVQSPDAGAPGPAAPAAHSAARRSGPAAPGAAAGGAGGAAVRPAD